jgi:rhamnopyranosyl-N-acetylglucosaminyl-diphospho-decaprenol beta-1,3/1,4-galactofuranosyltransferase
MIDKNMTVAAVVVTYNRKELLASCLEALLAQTRHLDTIYVIDNASTDGTCEMVTNTYKGTTVQYRRLSKNVGGAGGFHCGIELAYTSGFSWIWVMDDDSMPKYDCLEHLVARATPEMGFVAPLIQTEEGIPEAYHHKRFVQSMFVKQIPESSWLLKSLEDSLCYAIEIEANAFVGPLINRVAVDTVGLSDPGLFIMWDDTEYTYRISRVFRCYLIPKARIVHKDKSAVAAAAYGSNVDWKTYYCSRNAILFVRARSGMLASWIYACYLGGRAFCGTVWPRVPRAKGSKARYLSLRIWAVWDGVCNNKTQNRVRPPDPSTEKSR